MYQVSFTIKDLKPQTALAAFASGQTPGRVVSQNTVTDTDPVQAIEKAIRILQIERDAALENRASKEQK